MDQTSSIDLGFLETCEPWLLTNKFFPSKLGGKPAWLDLKNLPSPGDLLCERCSKPLSFLCQIYAPIEDNENCFHRTLYIFICTDESCDSSLSASGRNMKVYRSQLPRRNEFYNYDPPDETIESPAVKSGVPLCVVCGCHGPKRCGRCQSVNYCGPVHQRHDWKVAHKAACGEETVVENTKERHNTFVFPEMEIVTEPDDYEPKLKLSEEENEKHQMEEFERLKREGKVGVLNDLPEAELDKYAEDQIEDKVFARFKERTANAPRQVLRYERGGTPLWLSPIELQEIPKCGQCGGDRMFEFQIMPQLLSFLDKEKLDWGTLACFTCKASCSVEGYAEEFLFRQDVLDTTGIAGSHQSEG
ncbi:programmed cell death protein 2 [Anopheles bellator]|uniref:programmed cell death protein 2 n=1 Tax=Anopheles bellator TaxID=139047 RepID=UPI002649BCF1|nr:programmed cell death protein 2 [Anopheles bellator]